LNPPAVRGATLPGPLTSAMMRCDSVACAALCGPLAAAALYTVASSNCVGSAATVSTPRV